MASAQEAARVLEQIDAELRKLRPERAARDKEDRAALAATLANAPPMSEPQCRRIGRLLRSSTFYAT